jgi:phage terminase large subunit GpA-like protein
MLRKVWVNTVLGELWDDAFTTIDSHWLKQREEKYKAEVPAGALVLTAAVDTQDDRLEALVYGWGLEYENWIITKQVFMGNPGAADVWNLCDQFLLKEFKHERGVPINIATVCVDAMGHHTDMVYAFCKARFFRRVFAVQGVSGAGRPMVISYNHHNRAGVYLFRLGVDQGKETLYTRLKIKDPGPGYCHFPKGLEDSFYAQLTSEKRIMRHNAGIPRLEWVLPKGKRNEALDCSVYSMAALNILNPNLAQLAKENLIYKGTPAAPRVKRRIYSEGVKNV